MGQRNCKARIIVPSNPPCFPYFTEEKQMLEMCKSASKSLSQFREIFNLVSGLVMDASQLTMATICLSGTAALIQFLIHRLSNDKPQPNRILDPDQSDAVDPEQVITMEDILLEMKIDKCIVKAAVLGLKAKLTAISNRYDRLILKELSLEDRRLEVVPALALCEEIVELFRDPENVFAKNPISSTPFLVPFGGVYVAVAELSLAILPSYQGFLVKQMKLLAAVLKYYKCSCIQERQAVPLQPKCLEVRLPDTIIAGASRDEINVVEDFFLYDPFLGNVGGHYATPHSGLVNSQENLGELLHFETREEAFSAYRRKLEENYEAFFSAILKNVTEFSGFSLEVGWRNFKSPICENIGNTTEMIDFYENL